MENAALTFGLAYIWLNKVVNWHWIPAAYAAPCQVIVRAWSPDDLIASGSMKVPAACLQRAEPRGEVDQPPGDQMHDLAFLL